MERDFTNAPIDRLRLYGGANGNKVNVTYQGDSYMLKFPPKAKDNKNMSYANSCISEYVACQILNSMGMDVQETLLGTYDGKVVVACKDFVTSGYELKEFAFLKNTIMDSEQNGYGTDLDDILHSIKEQQIISPVILENYFWDMFICDAFLGNFDRHNGNWGFLINHGEGLVKLAPIFDCGSCLYPQMEEPRMKTVLESSEEIKQRVYVFPNSAIKNDNVKINYFDYLMTTNNNECMKAIMRISKKIDLENINEIIEKTPYILDIHKTFLKTMVKERKECIIDKASKRINMLELTKETYQKNEDELKI